VWNVAYFRNDVKLVFLLTTSQNHFFSGVDGKKGLGGSEKGRLGIALG